METFWLIIVIALIDSMSIVPIALVPLAALLGRDRSHVAAGALLGGIGLSYFVCGVLVLLGLSQLFATLDASLQRVWFEPNRLELALQIAIGAALLLLAWKLSRTRRVKASPQPGSSGALTALGLGVMITLVGLPGAVPYFGAIDQILRADVTLTAAFLLLLAYNVAFLTPLILLVAMRAVFPRHSAAVLDRVGAVLRRWGGRVTAVLLCLLGAVMILDGIGWFLGQPLIPVGAPPPAS